MKILVTGSRGLVGMEAVKYFSEKGDTVIGIDNDARSDTLKTPSKLTEETVRCDIRYEQMVDQVFIDHAPFDAIIHTAGQPSHDYSKEHVLYDFDVNARGTVNLLEAARKFSPQAVFVHCSTDKIYGEGMETPLIEDGSRYITAPQSVGISFAPTEKIGGLEFQDEVKPIRWAANPIKGFSEETQIRPALSPFGVAKLAADFYIQEYAAQGWLTTGTFRMGCITGRNHEGAEQHGFLAYLTKCIKEGKTYNIYGYKGKQVRDQIHAYDLVSAFDYFIQSPISGGVYNIGGGPERSCSVLEAGKALSEKLGKPFNYEIKEKRFGDRQWDVHDTSKFQKDYPDWKFQYSLEDIYEDLCQKS